MKKIERDGITFFQFESERAAQVFENNISPTPSAYLIDALLAAVRNAEAERRRAWNEARRIIEVEHGPLHKGADLCYSWERREITISKSSESGVTNSKGTGEGT